MSTQLKTMGWNVRKTSKKSRRKEGGGVVVEMGIGVSLIVLLSLGVLETGRLIFQIPWVSQTLYEIVLTGAENQQHVGITRMNQRSAQFANELNSALVSFNLNADYDVQTYTSNGQPRTMRVVSGNVQGNLIPFSNIFSFDIGMDFTMAHEATQPPLDARMMLPGLIQGQFYDCDGNSCGTSPCEIAPCGT